jgi:hypothetical protein
MRQSAPYELTIEERVGYLYVLYGGDPLTLEMILKIINTVATKIREHGYDRVLLVRNAPILENDENRAMVARIISNLLGTGVRFAIVDAYGNDPILERKAVESARAAGWDLTGFDTIEQAEAWLLASRND